MAERLSKELSLVLGSKGKTFISVILPLYNLSSNQKGDRLHIQKAVHELCDALEVSEYEPAAELVQSLHAVQNQIKFDRNDLGIGLFVSEDTRLFCTFPFHVTEHIGINRSFRIRELLLKEQYSIPYNLLYIDEKEIRLYTGKLKNLTEIRNGEFPMIYEEAYEYQPPSRSSSYAGHAHVKSFEKEKEEVVKQRHKEFLHRADEALHNYLRSTEVLVLCGVKRYTSSFLNLTAHANKVVSVLNGSYNRFEEKDFAVLAWPSMEAFIHEKMIDEVNEFNEKIGEGYAEQGIRAVWEAIWGGRGETLIVERNLSAKAYLTNTSPWELHLKPPKVKHTILDDAVNKLLGTMLEKGGRIVFVKDGMLKKHQGIVLITRY